MSDRCVCCGKEIPEGRMVCPNCEKAEKQMTLEEIRSTIEKLRQSGKLDSESLNASIKALGAQETLRMWIASLSTSKYDQALWDSKSVVKILEEFLI